MTNLPAKPTNPFDAPDFEVAIVNPKDIEGRSDARCMTEIMPGIPCDRHATHVGRSHRERLAAWLCREHAETVIAAISKRRTRN